MDDDTDGPTPPRPQPGPEPAGPDDQPPPPSEPPAAEAPAAEAPAAEAPAAEPTPSPPEPTTRVPARRWFLVGAGAVLVGAGAGVAAELVQHRSPAVAPAPPRELLAAAAAERALIADLDATTGGAPAVRRILTRARADHAAHLQALDALIAGYGTTHRAAPSAGATPAPKGTPRTRQQLRVAEQLAATTAARRAAGFSGARAALLASIAACEASHADLLT